MPFISTLRVPFIPTRQSQQRVGCDGVQEAVGGYTATLAGCVHKLLLRYLAGVVGGMDEARGVGGIGALYCMVPQVLMLLGLLVSLEQVCLPLTIPPTLLFHAPPGYCAPALRLVPTLCPPGAVAHSRCGRDTCAHSLTFPLLQNFPPGAGNRE